MCVKKNVKRQFWGKKFSVYRHFLVFRWWPFEGFIVSIMPNVEESAFARTY